MALLERIGSMKQAGMNDSQIVNALKEEGVTPREINEALSQMKIKSAIASPQESDMQASIMAPSPDQQQTAPVQNYQDQYQPQQEQYPPQQEQYYSQSLDIETIRDVAKQEIEEAMKKPNLEIDSLNKLKTELKFEVQNMENRLNKIESIIQELQTAIIRKMGEYGEAVSNISNDLRETQKSFSKVINPLLDKKRQIEQKEEVQEEPPEKQEKKTAKPESRIQKDNNSATFEDYFR